MVLLLVLPFLVLLLELARVFLLLSPIGETEIFCHRFKGLCYLVEFERIKEADAEQLKQAKGMNEAAAKRVFEHYRSEENG